MSAIDFLMPRGMQRVLAPLLLRPDSSLSLSDLIRAAGGGRGSTQRIVDRLLAAGIVTEERIGNQKRLKINPSHPLYAELRSIGMKTFGLSDRLREALRPVEQRIERAFIFGSTAGGTDGPGSDIDLLVVGDVDLFEVSELLGAIEQDLGRSIDLTLVDKDQWRQWRESPVGRTIASSSKIQVIDHGAG